ncbi:MAG: hypothetical protein QGI18_09930 [Candidatus Marinimicrobia bacterium]|nr:hypothetical protein [Candidatus Neomarinimicrobiota bacterium]
MLRQKIKIDNNSVVFLFINGPHHTHHLILPALNFAQNYTQYQTVLISGSDNNTNIIKQTLHKMGNPKCKIIKLPKPLRYYIKNYRNKIIPPPFSQWKFIDKSIHYSKAIISTSHQTPEFLIKDRNHDQKLFYLYHGVGTRSYGFEDSLNEYDFIFVPGEYHYNRLQADLSINKNKLSIVGHPKFEWQDVMNNNIKSFFNNNNPTFYYNPHWDLSLSSYKKWSKRIIQYFLNNKQFNLIFAPHPLIKNYSSRNKINIDIEIDKSNNIILDFYSNNTIDGSYLHAADVYIGDVSSMVTDFIIKKNRSCIFINSYEIDWRNDKSFNFWNCGKVINKLEEFDSAITSSLKQNKYVKSQQAYIKKMIHKVSISSSKLIADSIYKNLQK